MKLKPMKNSIYKTSLINNLIIVYSPGRTSRVTISPWKSQLLEKPTLIFELCLVPEKFALILYYFKTKQFNLISS